jgi:hypothetical protein
VAYFFTPAAEEGQEWVDLDVVRQQRAAGAAAMVMRSDAASFFSFFSLADDVSLDGVEGNCNK